MAGARLQETNVEQVLDSIKRIIADEDCMTSVGSVQNTDSTSIHEQGGIPAGSDERSIGPNIRRNGIDVNDFGSCAYEETVLTPKIEQDHEGPRVGLSDTLTTVEPLLSGSAIRAVSDIFGSLSLASGQTVEGLVIKMLRPMLQTWLNNNLPRIVERLVSDEINRVTRGL